MKGAPQMNSTLRVTLWSAALLSLPAVVSAAAPDAAGAAPRQLDSGTLGLLGAGLVALAISLRSKRRS